jgi:hypothetical protein
MRFKGWIIPLVLGGVIEVCMIGMLALGDLGAHIPIFFLFYGIAGVVYGIGVWQRTKISLSWICFFAVLFRVTLLLTEPSLSDDIFRYIWDGRVLASGVNPYLYPPHSEFLALLRDHVIYPYINHPDLPTIYPPVAQFFFLIAHALFGSVLGLKIMIVIADLLVGWVLIKLLQLEEKNKEAVIIYLWHPLVVVEGAGSGHMDFLGVMGLMLALWAWQVRRDFLAISLAGAAVLTKFLPLVLIPTLVRWSPRWFPTNWKALLLLPMVVLVGYTPSMVMDGPLWGSLSTYTLNWEFNSPLFWILQTYLGDGFVARKVIGGLFGVLILAVTLRRVPPLQAGFIIMAGFTLLTPTLHPWYLIWLIPFLVFNPQLPWIGFSLVVILAYEVLIGYRTNAVWEESTWVWATEYGTLLVLACVARLGRRRSGYCIS